MVIIVLSGQLGLDPVNFPGPYGVAPCHFVIFDINSPSFPSSCSLPKIPFPFNVSSSFPMKVDLIHPLASTPEGNRC